MATNVNIFNHEWCELVFVERNHNYGAFVIRQTSEKRHLLAMFVTFSAITIALTLPRLLKSDGGIIKVPTSETQELTKLIPVKTERLEIIPETKQESIRNFRRAMAFVVPDIVNDESVTENDVIPTMDSLNVFNGDISNATLLDGNPEGTKTFSKDIVSIGSGPEIKDFVEQMPRYPGGDEELFKYLGKNLNYPQIAVDNRIAGTAHVQFVVFANGEIGNITIIRGFEENCEKEAMRVIKSMKKWIPGKQNGEPVNVRMSIPVRFVLQPN